MSTDSEGPVSDKATRHASEAIEADLGAFAGEIAAPPPGDGFTWKPGDRIDPKGRFQLLDRLGEGGTGEVWRGRDFGLAQDVALKFVALDGPDAALRFVREAGRSRGLVHPRIVPTHEVLAGHGWGVLVQQLVVGTTLSALLQRRDGPRTPTELYELARGLLEGVAAVHLAGLVHRDLKPANLIVPGWSSGRRNFGDVRILDLGAARGDTALDGAQAGVTGTPGFMAPEQEAGQEVGPTADVWAVARVLRTAWNGSAGGLWPSMATGLARAEQNDPRRRQADAGAWGRELQPPPGPRRTGVILAAVGVVGLLGVMLLVVVGLVVASLGGDDSAGSGSGVSSGSLPVVDAPPQQVVDLPEAFLTVRATGVDDTAEVFVDGRLIATCDWGDSDCPIDKRISVGRASSADIRFRLTNSVYDGICLRSACGKYTGTFSVYGDSGVKLWSDHISCDAAAGCPGANSRGVKFDKTFHWTR